MDGFIESPSNGQGCQLECKCQQSDGHHVFEVDCQILVKEKEQFSFKKDTQSIASNHLEYRHILRP